PYHPLPDIQISSLPSENTRCGFSKIPSSSIIGNKLTIPPSTLCLRPSSSSSSPSLNSSNSNISVEVVSNGRSTGFKVRAHGNVNTPLMSRLTIISCIRTCTSPVTFIGDISISSSTRSVRYFISISLSKVNGSSWYLLSCVIDHFI